MRAMSSKWLSLLAVALGICCVPTLVPGAALAKVTRLPQGSFDGADAPGGSFGAALTGIAVDQASGDVYVVDSNFAELGKGVVDKFTADGVYAGVQITGAATPQGTFAFGLFDSGIAVDSSGGPHAGDVYVADSEHGVVDRFSSSGAYECQISGQETPSPSECAGGLAGSELPGAILPAGVTVDSAGDVYVADDAHAVVDELDPSGKLMRSVADPHLSNEMASIAVSSSGDLYVTNYRLFTNEITEVLAFDAAGDFVSVLALQAASVAVDPSNDDIEVVTSEFGEQALAEFEASGKLLTAVPLGAEPLLPVAVDGQSGKAYVGEFFEFNGASIKIFGPDFTVPNVTTQPATGVTQTGATFNGRVDPDAAHGGGPVSQCEFEYVTDSQFHEHATNRYAGAAVAMCEPSTPYASPTAVHATAVVTPDTTYHVRLRAANANGSNDGEGEAEAETTVTTPGPPAVVSEQAAATTTTATLRARIDPFGFATDCQLQYVDDADYRRSGYAGATTRSCSPAHLEAGFAADEVSVSLAGLDFAAAYHYRFLVSSQAGSTAGPDEAFTTFGIKTFSVETVDTEGRPYTQAGGHPYKLVTSFALNTRVEESEGQHPAATADIKDLEVELPPGLVGNPTATARCTRAELAQERCSGATQIGFIKLFNSGGEVELPLYNLVPPAGVPAELGGLTHEIGVYIDANVRSGGDYGITASVLDAPDPVAVVGSVTEIWGVPADPRHDAQRYCPVYRGNGEYKEEPGCSANEQPRPFLIDPTSCSVETARLRVDAWQDPGVFATATSTQPAYTGCGSLTFAPWISVLPDTSAEDSPSGLLVKLHVPQDEAVEGDATPSVREVVTTLPAGVTVNPAAANGLQTCTEAQIGLENAAVPGCPDASKVGSVEVESPLLPDPLIGSAYLATQNANPFGTTLALYIAVAGDGVLVKVAGKVQADPLTGQLTATFADIPQLPFSDFRLHFFGGPRAPLATPKTCGTYQASSTLTPWSAPESGAAALQTTAFQITTGPGGGACTQPTFDPGFHAGTTSNQAGGFSPFTFSMSRGDGEQNLGVVSTTLPPGLVGMLAHVPLCGEAQANAGTCPAASAIGHVTVGVGAGPDPLFVPEPGRPADPVYLTRPYHGAPFGLSVVVPAQAGPFDLDENGQPVVVRAAISVDPLTAQVTVTSDPVPQILEGVPLDVRSVNVTIDRPEFMFNPTSCERLQITGHLTSAAGSTTSQGVPFQATDCAALKFPPRFEVSTSGKTSRARGASLAVKLSYPAAPQGTQANIAKVKVELPKRLPSQLKTLQKACTAAQFAANPAGCPAASIVGHAVVHTPLLPVELEGPAYFVSHGGEAFPSLIIVLQGDNVTLDLVGSTFISRAGITSSTFKAVPDAPVETFELTLPQGPYAALTANGSLCRGKLSMPTEFVGQDGAVIRRSTPIRVTGCPRHKAPRRHRARAKHTAKRS